MVWHNVLDRRNYIEYIHRHGASAIWYNLKGGAECLPTLNSLNRLTSWPISLRSPGSLRSFLSWPVALRRFSLDRSRHSVRRQIDKIQVLNCTVLQNKASPRDFL